MSVYGIAEDKVERFAVISDNGLYRYMLGRRWGPGKCVSFVGLNPSTADAAKDDPTIRKCVLFAKLWGFNALRMFNLYAWRATDPKDLIRAGCPSGGEKALFVIEADADKTVICAWGGSAPAEPRASEVIHALTKREKKTELLCFGLTKNHQPLHPLYLPLKTPVVPFVLQGTKP